MGITSGKSDGKQSSNTDFHRYSLLGCFGLQFPMKQ
jgi:hypothetical protein